QLAFVGSADHRNYGSAERDLGLLLMRPVRRHDLGIDALAAGVVFLVWLKYKRSPVLKSKFVPVMRSPSAKLTCKPSVRANSVHTPPHYDSRREPKSPQPGRTLSSKSVGDFQDFPGVSTAFARTCMCSRYLDCVFHR